MSANNKLVWTEGLFLRPQHFQQHDRYLERFVELRSGSCRAYTWGFVQFELEHDLLAVGKLGLRRAQGVFPDGTPFCMPDDDPLPPPLEVDPMARDQEVFLALPLRRAAACEFSRDEKSADLTRFHVRTVDTRDVSADSDQSAELEVGGIKTRLLLQSSPRDGYACIPACRIVECRSDRRVVLDDQHIATVMNSFAAPRLATFTNELNGLLHQRGEALASRVSASGRGGAAEIADFLLLQVVNRCEPLAAHLCAGALLHPEDLYRVLLQMAGELATFTTATKRPSAFPVYRHEALRPSFEPVIQAIRVALSAVLEQTAIAIPLEKKKFGISVGMIPDKTLLDSAAFVLAARADIPVEDLRRRLPSQMKIGPVEKIRDLVNLQLPGIPVQPMPVAPRQIPYHAGYTYFELDQNAPLWKSLKTSGAVALHVSSELPGYNMELWAIRG